MTIGFLVESGEDLAHQSQDSLALYIALLPSVG